VNLPGRQSLVLLAVAVTAALIGTPTAEADTLASCAPPTGALTITSPDALAQSFTLTAQSDVSDVTVWLAAAASTTAHLAIMTSSANGPATTVLGGGDVAVTGATPTAATVQFPHPVRLDAGSYALVVDPPATGELGWAGCSSQWGAWFRNDGGVWGSLANTQFQFQVDGGAPDLTPPTTTITSAPAPFTNTSPVTVAFQASEPSTFACTVDAAAPVDCSSPFTVDALSDGPHTVVVAATDMAGNVEVTPPRVQFVLDRAAPIVTLSPTAPHAGDHTLTVQITTDEPATLTCSLDNANPSACTTPYQTQLATEGPHTLAVWATDQAGNSTPTPITTSVTADWTAPILTLPAPIDLQAPSPSGAIVTYAATATDTLDPNPVVACDHASGGLFAVGTTTVHCIATDASANTAAGQFTITVSPPPVTAAELNVTFDPAADTLVYTEPDGGTVTATGGLETAQVDAHSTVATLWLRHHRASITSLAYDGAAARRTNRNGYAYRIGRERDGTISRITLRVYAGAVCETVRYTPSTDSSIVFIKDARSSDDAHSDGTIQRVAGFVIPQLRTAAGQVTLIRG
jgi:hypothetical protein